MKEPLSDTEKATLIGVIVGLDAEKSQRQTVLAEAVNRLLYLEAVELERKESK